jgi:RNA polymerase sigma-70 factor, ECF subfamily
MGASIIEHLSSLLSLTDEQAMWRVQMHDDAAAFARLVHRWEQPIQNLCTRMTGDIHRAEDLAQEAFARVYARRKEYQAKGRFSTYLWRVALNLCYDELRRRNRHHETSIEADGVLDLAAELRSEGEEPSAALEQQERAEGVRRALMRLPDTYRTVVVLRHYENLKFREIAEVLEIPEGTVKSRMSEGLAQLARILKPAFQEEMTL